MEKLLPLIEFILVVEFDLLLKDESPLLKVFIPLELLLNAHQSFPVLLIIHFHSANHLLSDLHLDGLLLGITPAHFLVEHSNLAQVPPLPLQNRCATLSS